MKHIKNDINTYTTVSLIIYAKCSNGNHNLKVVHLACSSIEDFSFRWRLLFPWIPIKLEQLIPSWAVRLATEVNVSTLMKTR